MAAARPTSRSLPAVVRERLVRFSHPVRVVLFLDGRSLSPSRSQEFEREPFGHRLLASIARKTNQPTACQSGPTLGPHLDGNLIRGTADPATLDLERGLGIRQRLREYVQAGLARALLAEGQGPVKYLLRKRLLPVDHEIVDELRNLSRPVSRIGCKLPYYCS